MPAKKKGTEAATVSYEDGIEMLEAYVEQMEGGELTLEETLTLYEQGMALHKHLGTLLAQGERRIQMLQPREDASDDPESWMPLEVEE